MSEHEAERFKAVGDVLWGSAPWTAEAARKLSVGERTVRHWLAGTMELPEGVWQELATMAERKAAEVTRARAIIARMLSDIAVEMANPEAIPRTAKGSSQ